VIKVVVQLTIEAWLALEAGLLIRDRVRGKGSTARDLGGAGIVVTGPSPGFHPDSPQLASPRPERPMAPSAGTLWL